MSSLTNIIQIRKGKKLSTFCAFTDFSKAYDSVNRQLLWSKLQSVGVYGKMLNAVKSLYCNISVCIRVNNYYTNWFNVNCGLRQGCGLSPLISEQRLNDWVRE